MNGDLEATTGSAGPDDRYDMVIFKDLKVQMRDGINLSTDVYLPARNGAVVPGRWPTILGRTSYDKEAEWLWVTPVAKYFVPRGYAVVVQDLRGRHRSEGHGQYFHTVNPREGVDGYDTVEWVAAQPWSNGRIGTVGVSHGAVVQAALALYQPPHLTATWLDDSFFNWFANGARQGGALELDTLGMMFLHGHDSQEAQDDPAIARAMSDAAQHLRDWVMRMPLKPGCSPLSLIPSLEQIFFEYYTRTDYDEFWQQDCINFEAHLERFADVPT
ncbi:MAG TPA: CocE/NonD family hydrolase, partial [Chloroflexota bacterium]|nr:CocE/NonD family hydrolase [Chloroflexota bacterium]